MKDPSVARNASQWLEQQIEDLGGLYNAGVRSSTFKQWRQATLTVIQRIWPGDSGRSERFRRVPFSAPMGRPSERESREYYERGCAEAMTMLRALLAEIAESGVPEIRDGGRAVGAEPGSAEDDFPTVELPPATSSEAAAADAATRAVSREAAPQGRGQDAPPRIEGLNLPATTPPAFSNTAPESGRVTQRHGKSTKKNGARQRLKDMLGFVDSPAAAEPPRPAAAPVVPEAPGGSPAAPAAPAASNSVPAEPPPAKSEPDGARIPAVASEVAPALEPPEPRTRRVRPASSIRDVAPPEFQVPPETFDGHRSFREEDAQESAQAEQDPIPLPEPPAVPERDELDPEPGAEDGESAEATPEDAEAAERATEEFIRTSPVLTSQPRPVRRAPGPESVPAPATAGMSSGAAIAVAALATEVDRLGVPDGHRARARAALLDLARQLDTHDLSWDALRETVYFVMEFPPLGRRVLPLLLPYFDKAA